MGIGIVMGVVMVVMMGAMFFGGHHGMHGKHKDHAKDSAPVAIPSLTVQNSTDSVHDSSGSRTAEHPRE